MSDLDYVILSDKEIEDACRTFGKNIKSKRLENRKTQEEIALLLDLSNASQVGQVERSVKCPTVKTVYKYCKLHNMTASELLGF